MMITDMLWASRFLLLLLCVSFTNLASADNVPNCAPGSLQDYINLGLNGCASGEVTYSNFELFIPDQSGSPAVAGATDIQVATQLDANEDSTLSFSGFTRFVVVGPQSVTYNIFYTIDPPPIVGGENVSLDPPFGNVSGSQSYCLDSLFVVGGTTCDNGSTPTVNDFSTGSPTSDALFGQAEYLVDVRTAIALGPGLGSSGFDGLMAQSDVVPEPGTWILSSLGVLALCICRSRRDRTSH